MTAADAAMEHGSAAAAVEAHYGRRDVPARSAYANPPLRNFAPVTYPSQLNDHGFEEVTRNRAADVLQYRPRQARHARATSGRRCQVGGDARQLPKRTATRPTKPPALQASRSLRAMDLDRVPAILFGSGR